MLIICACSQMLSCIKTPLLEAFDKSIASTMSSEINVMSRHLRGMPTTAIRGWILKSVLDSSPEMSLFWENHHDWSLELTSRWQQRISFRVSSIRSRTGCNKVCDDSGPLDRWCALQPTARMVQTVCENIGISSPNRNEFVLRADHMLEGTFALLVPQSHANRSSWHFKMSRRKAIK